MTDAYCPPISGAWLPENGVVISPAAKAAGLYRTAAARFADACEENGVPTGVAIPRNVQALAQAAFSLGSPKEAAPLWTLARELLALAKRSMAA